MPHDGWHPHDHGDGHGHPHHHWHDPPTRRLVLAAATFLPFGGASAQKRRRRSSASPTQANRYLALLDDRQRRQVLIAFDSANRLDWHYIPRSRSGLSLGEMKPAQADAARALFATVLNEQGLRLLDGVRLLEGVLREQQGSWRDPGRYYLSVFGTPGRFPWGWRFEGHHLSLNVALPAAGHVAVTPFFVGAHPATVRDGPNKGFRLLGSRRGSGAPDHGRPQRRAAAHGADRQPLVRRDRGQPAARAGSRPAARARARRHGRRLRASVVETLMDASLATLTPDLVASQKQRVMAAGPRPLPLRLGRLAHARRGLLFPRPRTGDADRARQHPERRQPHPFGVARPRRRLRPRRAGRALSPPAAPLMRVRPKASAWRVGSCSVNPRRPSSCWPTAFLGFPPTRPSRPCPC